MKIIKRPAKPEVEIVEYNGKTYRRYPNGPRSVSRYFYTKHNCRNVALHRQVWINHNGPIPKGYLVHHIDHNLDNNDISNLECISTAEHGKRHRTYTDDKLRKYKREWAKKNRKSRTKPKTTFTCAHCGAKFKSHQVDRAKYCRDKCREQANRIKNGSKALMPINCVECGDLFKPKAANAKLCSDGCKKLVRKRYEQERHKRRYQPNG